MTYIEDVLDGDAVVDDIVAYSDTWHNNSPTIPLHDYLGLLWPEYAMWVEDGDTIDYVIEARRSGLSLLRYLRLRQEDEAAKRLLDLSRRYADEWQSVGEVR